MAPSAARQTHGVGALNTGPPEHIAIIRLLRFEGRLLYRGDMGPASGGGDLVGYFRTGDDAATACWQKYVTDSETQHEQVSRLPGGRERRGPSATP